MQNCGTTPCHSLSRVNSCDNLPISPRSRPIKFKNLKSYGCVPEDAIPAVRDFFDTIVNLSPEEKFYCNHEKELRAGSRKFSLKNNNSTVTPCGIACKNPLSAILKNKWKLGLFHHAQSKTITIAFKKFYQDTNGSVTKTRVESKGKNFPEALQNILIAFDAAVVSKTMYKIKTSKSGTLVHEVEAIGIHDKVYNLVEKGYVIKFKGVSSQIIYANNPSPYHPSFIVCFEQGVESINLRCIDSKPPRNISLNASREMDIVSDLDNPY